MALLSVSDASAKLAAGGFDLSWRDPPRGRLGTCGRDASCDAVAVWQRLHDILGRLILKMVGYSENYRPTMVSVSARFPVDWAQPATPAARRGYR
jgi:hypothetical protein